MPKPSTPFCRIPDCDSGMPIQGRQMCQRHYLRWYHHGDPLWEPPEPKKYQKCQVVWCADLCGNGGAKGYCSKHYSNIRRWGTPYGKIVQLRLVKPCTVCGELKALPQYSTDTRRPDGRQSVCLVCARKWKKEHPEEVREYKNSRGDHHTRRARLLNAPSEPYTFGEIGERDGWICWLCGRSVDPSVPYPDPLSRSIDHVKPLSRGGTDLRSNVRITHLQCNVEKGAREIPLPSKERNGN